LPFSVGKIVSQFTREKNEKTLLFREKFLKGDQLSLHELDHLRFYDLETCPEVTLELIKLGLKKIDKGKCFDYFSRIWIKKTILERKLRWYSKEKNRNWLREIYKTRRILSAGFYKVEILTQDHMTIVVRMGLK